MEDESNAEAALAAKQNQTKQWVGQLVEEFIPRVMKNTGIAHACSEDMSAVPSTETISPGSLTGVIIKLELDTTGVYEDFFTEKPIYKIGCSKAENNVLTVVCIGQKENMINHDLKLCPYDSFAGALQKAMKRHDESLMTSHSNTPDSFAEWISPQADEKLFFTLALQKTAISLAPALEKLMRKFIRSVTFCGFVGPHLYTPPAEGGKRRKAPEADGEEELTRRRSRRGKLVEDNDDPDEKSAAVGKELALRLCAAAEPRACAPRDSWAAILNYLEDPARRELLDLRLDPRTLRCLLGDILANAQDARGGDKLISKQLCEQQIKSLTATGRTADLCDLSEHLRKEEELRKFTASKGGGRSVEGFAGFVIQSYAFNSVSSLLPHAGEVEKLAKAVQGHIALRDAADPQMREGMSSRELKEFMREMIQDFSKLHARAELTEEEAALQRSASYRLVALFARTRIDLITDKKSVDADKLDILEMYLKLSTVQCLRSFLANRLIFKLTVDDLDKFKEDTLALQKRSREAYLASPTDFTDGKKNWIPPYELLVDISDLYRRKLSAR